MEPILHCFAYSLDYLREQIADVPDELLTAQPEGVPNHPAWTIGHLVFISQMIAGVIGIEPWLSEEWEQQYGPGSNSGGNASVNERGDRAADTRTSQKTDLFAALNTAQTKLIHAVATLTDAELDEPFPDPDYTNVFPTVRHALTQVLLGHTAFHVGQISVWRRAMMLPPMCRSYE